MKRLDLVVGSNGAGKSTFVELTLAPLLPRSVFVNADEIVVLDAGEVRERGTHAALLRKGGLYAEMWNRQAQERAEETLAAE